MFPLWETLTLWVFTNCLNCLDCLLFPFHLHGLSKSTQKSPLLWISLFLPFLSMLNLLIDSYIVVWILVRLLLFEPRDKYTLTYNNKIMIVMPVHGADFMNINLMNLYSMYIKILYFRVTYTYRGGISGFLWCVFLAPATPSFPPHLLPFSQASLSLVSYKHHRSIILLQASHIAF